MEEERKKIIVKFLINELKRDGAYGYDLWLSDRVNEHYPLWRCAVEILKAEPPPPYDPPTNQSRRIVYGEDTRETKLGKEIFPLVSDALWLLCLRGYLRPGVKAAEAQAVDNGQGYSLTAKGKLWVKSAGDKDVEELASAL